MTYADYQNTEPDFQDGPSDLPDPIVIRLPLTTAQTLTLRHTLAEVISREYNQDRPNYGYIGHLRELVAAIMQEVRYRPCAK